MVRVEFLTMSQLDHSDTFFCNCYLCNCVTLQKLKRNELLSMEEMERVLKTIDKYAGSGVPYPVAKIRCMTCQNENVYAINIYKKLLDN